MMAQPMTEETDDVPGSVEENDLLQSSKAPGKTGKAFKFYAQLASLASESQK